MFQLTTSRRGRHTPGRSFFSPTTSFNSRPHEEVDGIPYVDIAVTDMFQLTTSQRGRQLEGMLTVVEIKFQLTTSRRGRPTVTVNTAEIIVVSTHDLTKRSTNLIMLPIGTTAFQLTTSRRGRRL